MRKYLDKNGLQHLWSILLAAFVPAARTVNGKALGANITLTASDVGAATMSQVNEAITNSRIPLTESQYTALAAKDPNVLYLIKE